MNDNDNDIANEGQEFGDFGGAPTEAGEEEGDDGDDVDFDPLDDNDALEKVEDEYEFDGDEGRQRGWGGVSYSSYRNKGCRNYHGDKGSSHYDYDLYHHVDHDFCRSKCDYLGQHCYGYEYDSYSKKCEIWKVPIYSVEYVHGLDCYIKH
jgi:hypothetical protein